MGTVHFLGYSPPTPKNASLNARGHITPMAALWACNQNTNPHHYSSCVHSVQAVSTTQTGIRDMLGTWAQDKALPVTYTLGQEFHPSHICKEASMDGLTWSGGFTNSKVSMILGTYLAGSASGVCDS